MMAGQVAAPVSAEFRQWLLDGEREWISRPQAEMKVVIHRIAGIHARELHIPARVALTGAIHKYDNLNTLSEGQMLIAQEDGSWLFVQAPYTVVSPAGTKRLAVALTDCVWTTYFATDEEDPDKVVAEFTTNSEQEYLAHAGALTLEGK